MAIWRSWVTVPALCLASIVGAAADAAVRLHIDGGEAEFAVVLETDGDAVAGTQNDVVFEPEAPIAANSRGKPDCEANPAINKEATTFAFQPAGCIAGFDCTGMRALVLSFDNVDAIPDGSVLYTCRVMIPDVPQQESYRLSCAAAGASDPSGQALPAQCTDGEVMCEQVYPAVLTFQFSADPPAPVVGDRVTITVDAFTIAGGLVGLPEYRFSGADPYLVGDTSPRRESLGPNRQVYELQAAESGTARLTMGVFYETALGCAGSPVYSFYSSTSDVFALTILDPTPTPTATPAPPAPTATPHRSGDGGGCQIAAPTRNRSAWIVPIPIAALAAWRRRRRAAFCSGDGHDDHHSPGPAAGPRRAHR